MSIVPSDAVTLLSNRESAPGVATTGPKDWLTLQPNPGGIVDLKAKWEALSREILSKNLTDEAGDHVGMTVEPKIIHDLTYDYGRQFGPDWFRCAEKHAGNKGQSTYHPTGVTATGFTVTALGDLANGLLGVGKGWTIPGNNGLKLLAGTSTNVEIKCAGLAIEAGSAANANATFEVCGVQGDADDYELDASGNLICTTGDFTTKGIQPEEIIKIGGDTAVTQFANALYNGYAIVDIVAAKKLTLKQRTWTPGLADDGADKTIQVFYSGFSRNVPWGHADFTSATSQLEMEQPGAGAGDTSSFRYAKGLAVKTTEIDAPLKNKIVITQSYIGMIVPPPVLAAGRTAGASTALAPLGAQLFDTSSDVKCIKLASASNDGTLAAEITKWKLTIELNVKPREFQGRVGAGGHTHGKIQPKLDLDAYFLTDEIPTAVADNRDVTFMVVVGNGNGGFGINIPAAKLRDDTETFAAGDAVMIGLGVPAHRDPATNITVCMTRFAYLPE